MLEQSLDIDFDYMITELCPMDLLLQRSGRLHRHNRTRPDKLSEPELCVLIPEDFSKSVYSGWILTQTEKYLPDKLVIPGCIPELVGAVYSEPDNDEQQTAEYREYSDEQKEKKQRARKYCIPSQKINRSDSTLSDMINRRELNNDSDGEAAVRDGQETIEALVLVKTSDTEYSLFSRDEVFDITWLLHIICFDDIAAKQPTPKKPWVGRLGLIAVRGNNLFETLMLNYNAESDSEYDVYVSTPSWEKDNNNAEFNTLIPVPDNQAALLSLMSRRVYLCRENGKVNGYYLSGGDYFEEDEVFSEQMTLWRSYKEKGSDSIKYKPQLHKPSTKAWQEFGSIAALEDDENSSTARKPGIIAHIESYIDKGYLDNSFLLTGYDIDEYTGKIEDTVRKIAIVFGNDCVHQMSANTIFGRYDKGGKDKNLVTSVKALNIFNATINKIFRKEGDDK